MRLSPAENLGPFLHHIDATAKAQRQHRLP
jgi:hypothetical protein